MKKPIIIFLSFIMLLSVFSGCSTKGENNEMTLDGSETTTAPITNPIPVAKFDGWVSNGYEKVESDAKKPKRSGTDIELYMAKNEKEGFNVSIRCEEAIEGLNLVLASGNTDGFGIEIFNEYLIPTKFRDYPDGLVPYYDGFNVDAGVTKTHLIRFSTDESTKAGEYSFKFELRSAGGDVLQEYNAKVKVWDFALPKTLTSDGITGLDKRMIIAKEKINGPKGGTYYRMYYEMLLQYGFSTYDLPYDILDERADAYMSDPRVSAFTVPHDETDEKILQYYEKLKTNSDWLSKAMFYPYDEPANAEHFAIITERCERLRELCPDIRIIIPFFLNVKVDNSTDEVDFLSKYVDLWCPKSACFKEGWLADPLNKGFFGDRMKEEKAGGDTIWWYVCWEPRNPFCNLQINESGLNHTKLFWQQYLYGVEGILFWAGTYWHETENPWTDMETIKSISREIYGDGSLLYPGNYVGVEGPVASLRLECARNGMEDYDLLLIAEELLGQDWVTEQVKKVTKNMTQHTTDAEEFEAVRKAIGDAIENAYNK